MIDPKTGNEVYTGSWEGSLSECMANLNDEDLQETLFGALLPCFSCVNGCGQGVNEDCIGETGCSYEYVGGGFLKPSKHDDGRA